MWTNPLFAVVTGLLGLLVGLVIGRRSRNAEWDVRERLLREALPARCFIRGQVEAGQSSSDSPTP
jgi:hypothetical protein